MPVFEAYEPVLLQLIESDGLRFRPEFPGGTGQLALAEKIIHCDLESDEENDLIAALAAGAFTREEVQSRVVSRRMAGKGGLPPTWDKALARTQVESEADRFTAGMRRWQMLDQLGLVAVRVIDRVQRSLLLEDDPLADFKFTFTDRAKLAVRLGWEAIAETGRFPLPPHGPRRIADLRRHPSGVMHFVSASDQDAGYFFTMGIALSPEAQALGEMDASYGLDGELIVPGQAVSPIPPTLALATRLFAASIPTSSNISEEVQAITYSNFPHPDEVDARPRRGYRFAPISPELRESQGKKRVAEACRLLLDQVARDRVSPESGVAEDLKYLPDVVAAIDVTQIPAPRIVKFATSVLDQAKIARAIQKRVALFLVFGDDDDEESPGTKAGADTRRVRRTKAAIDAAAALGLRYVAVCDDHEDDWLPNLLEYFTPEQLEHLADYSDERKVVLCDGRPIDAVYTASTSAQRIQSVYTTLSVDILKMGMWLCLDALTARRVWFELHRNPHIPRRMFLMPIGIVEPFSAFVDNRNRGRTPRPILDPFAKIKFMIEEAELLGTPSLLTDTRHKERWVLLGSIDGDLPAHVREKTGAIPLIGRKTFMKCETLASRKGVLLGQAGSIESDQIFWIVSDCTLAAALTGENPATAIWTAETERVLRTSDGESLQGDLQSQRRANVLPYLAVVNRTFESHAKIDGWLRFLDREKQGDEPLRRRLLDSRASICLKLQDELAGAARQSDARAGAYQQAWERFASAFRGYHAEIKGCFKAKRNLVAQVWAGRSDPKG